jgi:phage I-like protein
LDSLGYPVRLVSCALTNTPNLRNLPPILNKSAGQDPAHNTTSPEAVLSARYGASPATNGEKGDAQMKDILLALGLPETAEPAVVLNKVKEVLGQVVTLQTELKDIKTAALNKEAEEFVVLNSARIKLTDRDAVKARYVADKDNVVALFAALAEPQPTGRMVLNRADSRTPAAAGGNPETKSVERLALIRQIEAEHKVAPTVAFNMAQSRRPELFRE